MTGRICVITPSFSQGRFIERTIRSVLDQGIPDLDYVVVDGGSSDDTVDILRRYGDRLRFISEADKGQSDAVNKGLAMTDAPVIGWLNSDDVYYPGALSAVLAYFETHPDVDVVYGDAMHIDEHDRVIGDYPTEPWSLARLAEVCFLCQPATFFRRRVVERFGSLDAALQYCMDYEFWLRLGQQGAVFAHLPQMLAGSRLYAENKTLGKRAGVHAEINTMLKTRLGRVPDHWIASYAQAALAERTTARTAGPRFVGALVFMTLSAGLRWNRRLSVSLLLLVFRWLIRGVWSRSLSALRSGRAAA